MKQEIQKHIFTVMALAAALCACTKEQMNESDIQTPEVIPQEELVFTATMEGAPETRATYDGTYKCASWEVGDQISINGTIFKAKSAGTSTTFREAETKEIRPAFVSGSPVTNTSTGVSPDKLVDSEGTSTKWCDHVLDGGIYVIVSTGTACKLQSIKLWNGNDTQSQSGRSWKDVKVYGASSAEGPWDENALIKSFSNLNLATTNKGLAGELSVNSTKEYKYYKVEVLSTMGQSLQQMSDMKFVVTPPSVTSPYEAYFPSNLYDGTTAMLPSAVTETWADGKFNMPMYAHSGNTDLQFKNLCGVLKIAVKNDQMAAVKSIMVSSTNCATSGAFTVDSNNAAVLTAASNTANTVTVTYTAAVTTDATGKVFNVAIPAQTYQNLKIELSADGNSFSKSMTTKSGADIVVSRNKIYPITFTANATSNPDANSTEMEEGDENW